MTALQNSERANLRQFLEERFNLSELKCLAFDIGIKHELFEYGTISDFVRELITYCDRRGQSGRLVKEIQKHRPEQAGASGELPAQLRPGPALTKLQVNMAESSPEDFAVLLAALAVSLRISEIEITLVAVASGSARLLVSVPVEAVDFRRFAKIKTLLDGRYHVLSIEAYEFLDEITRNTWRLVATEYPPLRDGTALYPLISWEEARRLVEKTPDAPVSSGETEHWLGQPDNQRRLYTIGRNLVDKLAPREAEQLENRFPRYVELAQLGRVQTARQAAQAFQLGGAMDSTALAILSVLFTAFSAWLAQQNRQTLAELKLRQEADRTLLYRLLDDALKENRIAKRERERLRPYLAEAITKEISDLYSPYEQGLAKLAERVGQELELLTYAQQLRENIGQTRRYGDTVAQSSRRSEITEQLNRFSLRKTGQSFNDLCRIDAI